MQAAGAYPEGAPWGSANPDAAETCATCHFGDEAIHDSAALRLLGLPDAPQPDTTYALVVEFDSPDGVGSGFQMIAWAADDVAGELRAVTEHTESIGSAIRSTQPVEGKPPIRWRLEWRTPERLPASILIHVAASSANIDNSPFGDTIHYRTYRLLTK